MKGQREKNSWPGGDPGQEFFHLCPFVRLTSTIDLYSAGFTCYTVQLVSYQRKDRWGNPSFAMTTKICTDTFLRHVTHSTLNTVIHLYSASFTGYICILCLTWQKMSGTSGQEYGFFFNFCLTLDSCPVRGPPDLPCVN